jgi:CRP/FNR family cyclic AMP-dependent transcriptional regulator
MRLAYRFGPLLESDQWRTDRAKRHNRKPDAGGHDGGQGAVLSDISADTARLDEDLAAGWLTHELSAHTRARLAELGRRVSVRAGEVLMREGDPADFLAVVIDGRVGLRMRVPERGQVTVLTVEPGDVIGWSAIVPPYRSTSTPTALADTELAYFEGPTLRAALAEDAEFAADIYPVLLKAVSRRLEGTRLQLLDLFSHRWVEPW